MLSITDDFIDRVAPNPEAARSGRGLVLQDKFQQLSRSADDSLLFGYCAGSGKQPYLCSADFLAADSPIFRCTCPSRQFPCKHSLGLLFAVVQGKEFSPAEIPAELAAKRSKSQANSKPKNAANQTLKKVNQSALLKKIQAQLSGIDLLEKLTLDLARLGIGNMNARHAHEIEEHAKQLGNAYLPGAQSALRGYTRLFSRSSNRRNDGELTAAQREAVYSDALDQLGQLHSLVKQGRAYLQQRLEDLSCPPETNSAIAAWLGHAWKLQELKDAGLVQEDVELVQLAFNSHDDAARQEIVDTGIWLNLNSGQIQHTQVLRPYKALKHVKGDDSFFGVAQVKELCIYPGDANPRVRWDSMVERPITTFDLDKIRSLGRGDFATVAKEVKNQIKGPLADKTPIVLLNYKRIGQLADQYVLEDEASSRLVLNDRGISEEPPSCHLVRFLPQFLLENQTLLVRFRHDLDTRKLQVKPLAVISRERITRLTL